MSEEKKNKLCPFQPLVEVELPAPGTVAVRCEREKCELWGEGRCALSTFPKIERTLEYTGNALRHLLPSEGVDATVPGRIANALEKIAASLQHLGLER